MKLPQMCKQELFDAIRAGVHDAIWRMITNATDMPCADFYEMIQKGVEKGIGDATPSQQGIVKAIADGVFNAIPFSDQIMSAVTDGVKESRK